MTSANSDEWGATPGKREYEIIHSFYLYDN